MALLRSQWRQIVVLVSKRHDIQSDSIDLRLVVQCKVRNDYSAIRVKRTAIQVHLADYAEVSRGFHRPGSGSILGTQI